MRTAVYPGSFDPMTNGHVDLIQRGCRIFDRVLVAVLRDPEKGPALFSVEERVLMVKSVFRRQPKVRVKAFSGLLVNFLRTERANVVVRGLHAVSDFEHELQTALLTRRLDPEVETIFLTPKEDLSCLSSRLVKEVHRLGGDVSGLVPSLVHGGLVKKLPKESARTSRTGRLRG